MDSTNNIDDLTTKTAALSLDKKVIEESHDEPIDIPMPPMDLGWNCVYDKVKDMRAKLVESCIVGAYGTPTNITANHIPLRHSAPNLPTIVNVDGETTPIKKDLVLTFRGTAGPVVISKQAKNPRLLARGGQYSVPQNALEHPKDDISQFNYNSAVVNHPKPSEILPVDNDTIMKPKSDIPEPKILCLRRIV